MCECEYSFECGKWIQNTGANNKCGFACKYGIIISSPEEKNFASKKFGDDNEVKEEVMMWFKEL